MNKKNKKSKKESLLKEFERDMDQLIEKTMKGIDSIIAEAKKDLDGLRR